MLDSAIYSAGLDGAITLLREAVREDPASADAHYRLGRCLLLKGLKTEAGAEFAEALKLDPKNAGALGQR